MILQKAIWAAKRLLFYVYLVFCLLTVVGGFLTAPLFTYVFFGDWRFWRYLAPGWKMFFHGWRFLIPLLKWENSGFMFSVPLTSPPKSAPDLSIVKIRADWADGSSCGSCSKCCDQVSCPVLDKDSGLCLGYNAFFWRYFNCGRFPSYQSEIDYYSCPKWQMLDDSVSAK